MDDNISKRKLDEIFVSVENNIKQHGQYFHGQMPQRNHIRLQIKKHVIFIDIQPNNKRRRGGFFDQKNK